MKIIIIKVILPLSILLNKMHTVGKNIPTKNNPKRGAPTLEFIATVAGRTWPIDEVPTTRIIANKLNTAPRPTIT